MLYNGLALPSLRKPFVKVYLKFVRISFYICSFISEICQYQAAHSKALIGSSRIFRVNEAIMREDFKRLNFKFMSLDAFLTANNLRFSKFALRFGVDYAYIFCAVFYFYSSLAKGWFLNLATKFYLSNVAFYTDFAP